MKTSDFKYELPDELIASRPLEKRDSSRLMVLDRAEKSITHKHYVDLPEFLNPGDRVVFNDTKVIPGRVFGFKESGSKAEMLFTKQMDAHTWSAIVRPGKRLKAGAEIFLEKEPDTKFVIKDVLPDGDRVIYCEKEPIADVLERIGEMPIPPYMERRADEVDRTTYQTVFARERGAVAAPTAGLHFTDDLLDRLKEKGVDISYITLHVGIGTFRPVKEENPLDHPMHSEEYEVTPETAAEINKTKASGGRVVAVGTTVVRTLEHSSSDDCKVLAGRGSTELMILPGYTYKIIDSLVTNFHLPESTLLMLVSALYSKEEILRAYEEAVKEKYRFYSYGDGMIIL